MFDEKENSIIRFTKIGLTIKDSTILYDTLFVHDDDLTLPLHVIVNRLKLTVAADAIYSVIYNIIYDYGVRNGLPWTDKFANLHLMTKERLQTIVRYNKDVPVDFREFILGILSVDQYYTLYDILNYGSYNSSIEQIIHRHPLLYAYKRYIHVNDKNRYTMTYQNILDELKDVNDTIPIEELAKAIYQNICITYNKTDKLVEVLDKLSIVDKDVTMIAIAKGLNKLLLYISPNYDLNSLYDIDLKTINNLLFSVKYYKCLAYLKDNLNVDVNKVHILLNILYRRSNVLNEIAVKDDTSLEIILRSALGLDKYTVINDIIKHIRTIIKISHPNTSYDLLLVRVTQQSKLGIVAEMLLFGQ
jgi:hypothetical protein